MKILNLKNTIMDEDLVVSSRGGQINPITELVDRYTRELCSKTEELLMLICRVRNIAVPELAKRGTCIIQHEVTTYFIDQVKVLEVKESFSGTILTANFTAFTMENTMNSEKYKLGYTACYIQDHPFSQVCRIPAEAAVEWVKRACPDVYMGGCKAKELTVGSDRNTDVDKNGWTNKLFVLVANEHGGWIALVNWDTRFHIYIER